MVGLVLGVAIGPVFAANAPQSAASEHAHPDYTDSATAAPVILAPGYADLAFVPPDPGSYALPALGEAANGPVVDTQGRPRELYEYLGDKITVLSFIFTRCSDVNGCPLASFVLKGVQDRLLELPELRDQVRLISFSFDPDYDSPAVLAEYGGRFVTDHFDWQFLSCANATDLAGVLRDYDQWVIVDYDDDGRPLGTMSHLLRVYLIDRDRRIRNIYSVSFLHADTLANDIRTLLAEAG